MLINEAKIFSAILCVMTGILFGVWRNDTNAGFFMTILLILIAYMRFQP